MALACGRGENPARKILYERYCGILMAVCLRYVSDRMTAEDVLHDGFIRIYQMINRFAYQGEGSLKAWLLKVMANEALGYLRKQNVRQQSELPSEQIPDLPDDSDSVFEEIPQQVLMQFIRELPDGYRTVFNLYVFEEKSHKEIGSLLGITERTSSSQFYRAKCLLIKKINEYREKNS